MYVNTRTLYSSDNSKVSSFQVFVKESLFLCVFTDNLKQPGSDGGISEKVRETFANRSGD